MVARINLEKIDYDNFDKDQDLPVGRKKRKKKKSFKRKFKFACCSTFLVAFVFLLIIVTASIAKTGIFEIPIFSTIFYRIPQATREVVLDQDSYSINFSGQLSVDDGKTTTKAEVSEGLLTYMARRSISTGSDPYFNEDLQIVINQDKVEIFGFLLRPFRANVTLNLSPRVNNKKVDLELIDVKVGSLSLPGGMFKVFISKIIDDLLVDVNDNLEKFGDVSNIEETEGSLFITLVPN